MVGALLKAVPALGNVFCVAMLWVGAAASGRHGGHGGAMASAQGGRRSGRVPAAVGAHTPGSPV